MPIAPTPAPNIPTPVPSTTDTANFDARADATLLALPAAVDGINALGATTYSNAVEAAASAAAAIVAKTAAEAAQALAVGSSTYMATSTSTLTMAAGTKTIVLVEAGKAFKAGDEIVVVSRVDNAVRLNGSIDIGGVTGQTLTASVAADGVVGAGGPYADWIVYHAAFVQVGATAAEVRQGTNPNVAISPKAFRDSAAFQTLPDAATVTWDVALGDNAKVTLGGNRTIAAPTNMADGMTYTLDVGQDATGGRVPVLNTIFDFGSLGTPTFSTGANKVDKITGQYSAVRNKLDCGFRKAS